MNAPVETRKPRLLILSGILALVIGTIYAVLPVSLAAIFIWPLTLWVLIGIALVAAAHKSHRKQRLGLIASWLVIWLVLDDQLWAFLPRFPAMSYNEFKIVSLNCAGGNPKAAAEAATSEADLILLQESPNSVELESIRASLGSDWSLVHGPDASILSRGTARRVPLPPGTLNFVAAEWRGTLVLSVRLQPPIFRLDYWSPECWRAYTQNRESRIKELREVMAWVQKHLGEKNLIIGGDFNSPPDRIFMEELSSIARDAFAGRGRWWGATAINAFPMVRIDQIWLGGFLGPADARARTTQNSDHRMVIVTAFFQT